MDVKIEWSDEPVGYGKVIFSGYSKAIVYLINEEEGNWGWAVDNMAVEGFKSKKEAQDNVLKHFQDGRSNFYERHYGYRD